MKHLKTFLKTLYRWLQPDCPHCFDAKLKKNGKYHTTPSLDIIMLYECEECKTEFIPI